MGPPDKASDRLNRLPLWLRKKRDLESLHILKSKLRCSGLSTVCEEARCPNISECFNKPTATFLILGDRCTRSCSFCSVASGIPEPPNPEEPVQVASAVSEMGLSHSVITSVTRDDLPDGGASAFAATIRAIKKLSSGCSVEVLTPDFSGRQDLVEIVLSESPEVFGHNMETVQRLYPDIRPGANFARSLSLLQSVKRLSKEIVVKSGFMVGLGETESEIEELLTLLKDAGCDAVTIGQYLRPTRAQTPVRKYWDPGFYGAWSKLAKSLGIGYCIAGPFVRSSYRAGDVLQKIRTAQ